MCFFNCVTRFLFFMYGTLGPAYHTYKTLNTGDDAFLAWAKYWIVYAFLITIEVLADTFISWLPLYTPTKLLLVLWIVLSAPAANVWMFDAIVRPVLSRRQEQIDNFLNRGKDKFLGDIVNLMKWLVVRGRAFVVPFITQMWIRGIMKSPEDDLAAAIGEDNESHEGSEQTSAKNLSICSSPLASSNFANDDSDAFQLSVSKASTHLHHHSSHSLNDLPRNKLVQSPIFMQRKVSRKMGKRLTEEAHHRSGSTLSLSKEEFFDDVEDLLAKTQNETLSQDLHEQRQHIHRRRLTAP
ncbi:hypothetical protein KR074_002049 [Drosophila pseudoananassae]|nr:hypothetical protein KR074_002049 [Drosophila pseudoananassae]